MENVDKQNLLFVIEGIEEKLEANGKLKAALEAVSSGRKPETCEDDLVSLYISVRKLCRQIGIL